MNKKQNALDNKCIYLKLNEGDARFIDNLAQNIHELACAKGWHDDKVTDVVGTTNYTTRACMLLVSEVSELFEALRNNTLDQPCDKLADLTNLEEELADIFIRTCDMAKRLGVDIGRAVMLKHNFNTTRPYRHGGKKA